MSYQDRHAPAVRAVLRHEDRFLLVQHNHRKPENLGQWGIPGGRVENFDADLIEALRREIREEFESEIRVIGFIHTYTYKNRDHHVFLAAPANLQFITHPDEILETAWLTLAEVTTLHHAGKLHTGFELDAIERSLTLLSLS